MIVINLNYSIINYRTFSNIFFFRFEEPVIVIFNGIKLFNLFLQYYIWTD